MHDAAPVARPEPRTVELLDEVAYLEQRRLGAHRVRPRPRADASRPTRARARARRSGGACSRHRRSRAGSAARTGSPAAARRGSAACPGTTFSGVCGGALEARDRVEQRPRVRHPDAARTACASAPARPRGRRTSRAPRRRSVAARPRSWLIMISAMPSRCWRSRRSSMIWAWVVTSSAVVASSAISSFGVARDRDRDHHALAHAAGELVGVLLEALRARRAGGRARISSSARSRAAARRGVAVGPDRLDDLRADAHRRVERARRVLEDHRDRRTRGARASPARTGRPAPAVEADRATSRVAVGGSSPIDRP